MQRACSILLLENDPNEIELFQSALRGLKRKTTVEVARTVSDAKKLISNGLSSITAHLPDIVFVDLGLDQESGLDFIRWCRSDPRLARLSIIVLSGSKAPQDHLHAYKNSVSAFEPKPAGLNDLTEQISRILSEWCN